MAQKKLYRFAAIRTFSNVFEYPEGMAGQWTSHFGNANPIVLELACGRGEYTVGLSRMYAQRNHIGVDLKGNRMYIGAKTALAEGLNNAAFCRTQIERIHEFFAPEEVAEIWITFPDPQLRISKAKKRLTHPRFLRLYRQLLQKEGCIHLKTDSPVLYNFTLRVCSMYGLNVLHAVDDVYGQAIVPEVLKIRTHYERLDIAQSKRVFYICFTLPEEIPQLDEELQKITRHEEEVD
jgi:tRNA (guanine-N7-)-methyltransferase